MEKADFDFRISDLILKVLNPHRESAVGGLGAVGIPLMKIALQNPIGLHSERLDSASRSLWGKTRPVAKLFGTNVRTVKYIWNRKTFSHATKYLWSMEPPCKSPACEQKVVAEIHSISDKSVLRWICFSDCSKRQT